MNPRSALSAADIETEDSTEDHAHPYLSPGKTFMRRPPTQDMNREYPVDKKPALPSRAFILMSPCRGNLAQKP